MTLLDLLIYLFIDIFFFFTGFRCATLFCSQMTLVSRSGFAGVYKRTRASCSELVPTDKRQQTENVNHFLSVQ